MHGGRFFLDGQWGLNRILDRVKPELKKSQLRFFHTRLGANFYAIHSLFRQLYGHRDDLEAQMLRLVEVLAQSYIDRPKAFKKLDRARRPRSSITIQDHGDRQPMRFRNIWIRHLDLSEE